MGLESQSPQERAEQQRIAAEAARRRAAEAKRREEAKRKAEEEARRREAEKPQQDKATIEAKAAEARKRFQERIRNHEAEEQAKAEQIRQHEATKATLDKIRAQAQEKKAAIPPANAPHFAKTNLDSIREQALLKKEQQQNVKPQQAKLAQDLKQHSGIQNILNRSSFTGALGLGAGLLNPLVGASILGSSLFSPTPKSPVDQKSPQDEPKKSSGFFNKILSLGSQAIEGAKALGGKTAESVKPLGNDIAEVAKPAVISQPQTEEKKGGGGLFGSMISFGKKAFQGATQLGSEAIEAAKTVVSQPQTEEKKDGGGLLGSVMSFGRKAFEGAKTVAAAVNPLVSAATLGGPSEEKKDAGGGLFGSVMSFGKKAFEGAKAFGEKAVENAQHLGSDVVQGAKAVGSWVEKNKDLVKDIGHTALDVAGFIPVIGTAADLVNAGWYAAEGRYTEAAASAMSAIPGVGDAFAAGKMGVKLATAAPKAMKVIQTASHLAPMAPALFQAGDAALHGDFAQAALTAGTAFVPALGGKAGQRLLGKAEASGSKMQAFAGNVLARGSGAMPNAIGATQVYQTYEAYKNGEGSGWELAKSALYAGAPFAFGRGKQSSTKDVFVEKSHGLDPGEIYLSYGKKEKPRVNHGEDVHLDDIQGHVDKAREITAERSPFQRLKNKVLGRKSEVEFGTKGWEFNHEASKHQVMADRVFAEAEKLRAKGDDVRADRLEQKAHDLQRSSYEYEALSRDPNTRGLPGDGRIAANKPTYDNHSQIKGLHGQQFDPAKTKLPPGYEVMNLANGRKVCAAIDPITGGFDMSKGIVLVRPDGKIQITTDNRTSYDYISTYKNDPRARQDVKNAGFGRDGYTIHHAIPDKVASKHPLTVMAMRLSGYTVDTFENYAPLPMKKKFGELNGTEVGHWSGHEKFDTQVSTDLTNIQKRLEAKYSSPISEWANHPQKDKIAAEMQARISGLQSQTLADIGNGRVPMTDEGMPNGIGRIN